MEEGSAGNGVISKEGAGSAGATHSPAHTPEQELVRGGDEGGAQPQAAAMPVPTLRARKQRAGTPDPARSAPRKSKPSVSVVEGSVAPASARSTRRKLRSDNAVADPARQVRKKSKPSAAVGEDSAPAPAPAPAQAQAPARSTRSKRRNDNAVADPARQARKKSKPSVAVGEDSAPAPAQVTTQAHGSTDQHPPPLSRTPAQEVDGRSNLERSNSVDAAPTAPPRSARKKSATYVFTEARKNPVGRPKKLDPNIISGDRWDWLSKMVKQRWMDMNMPPANFTQLLVANAPQEPQATTEAFTTTQATEASIETVATTEESSAQPRLTFEQELQATQELQRPARSLREFIKQLHKKLGASESVLTNHVKQLEKRFTNQVRVMTTPGYTPPAPRPAVPRVHSGQVVTLSKQLTETQNIATEAQRALQAAEEQTSIAAGMVVDLMMQLDTAKEKATAAKEKEEGAHQLEVSEIAAKLEDAEKRARLATQESESLKQRLEDAQARVREAQEQHIERQRVEMQLEEARAEIERCKASIAVGDRGEEAIQQLQQELDRRECELVELISQAQDHEATIAELRSSLEAKEAKEQALRDSVQKAETIRRELDKTKDDLRKCTEANQSLSKAVIALKKPDKNVVQPSNELQNTREQTKMKLLEARARELEAAYQREQETSRDARQGIILLECSTKLDEVLMATDNAVMHVLMNDEDQKVRARQTFANARRVMGDKKKVANILCRMYDLDTPLVMFVDRTINRWQEIRNKTVHRHLAYEQYKPQAESLKNDVDRVTAYLQRGVEMIRGSPILRKKFLDLMNS